MSTPAARGFPLLWLGQFVAMTGAGLTEFGMSVWLVQHSNSVSQYTLNTLFALVPGLLIAPVAGSLIDRVHLRRVAFCADGGAALATLVACWLLFNDLVTPGWVYFLTACLSICQAFQMLVYPKAASLLVDKAGLGRANGMIQFAYAVSRLIAPAAAGVLIGLIALKGILLLNLLTALFAVITLLLVIFPAAPERTESAVQYAFSEALHYLKAQPLLLAMMAYTALESFAIGLVMVLVTPMVLATHGTGELGALMSCAMLGMVVGSVIMMAKGAPRRLTLTIFGIDLVTAFSVLVFGAASSLPLLYIAAFITMAGAGISGACNQTLWQRKVPLALQGRIFAVRQICLIGAIPVAALLGGLLADSFNPLMLEGGALAATFGSYIGSGEGRGIGLIFAIDGIFLGLAALLAMLSPRLRQLESQLPDAE